MTEYKTILKGIAVLSMLLFSLVDIWSGGSNPIRHRYMNHLVSARMAPEIGLGNMIDPTRQNDLFCAYDSKSVIPY